MRIFTSGMEVTSTVINDGAGTMSGANSVSIHYLDSTGNLQTENLLTSGTTGVLTVATNIRFVNEFHTLTVGNDGVAQGQLKLHASGDDTTVYNLISGGGNMSLVPNRMVPAGHTLYITNWNATVSGKVAQDQQLALRLRSTDHDGTLVSGVFLFKSTAYLKDAALTHQLTNYVKVPEYSIVKVSAWADVAGSEISTFWEGILVSGS